MYNICHPYIIQKVYILRPPINLYAINYYRQPSDRRGSKTARIHPRGNYPPESRKETPKRHHRGMSGRTVVGYLRRYQDYYPFLKWLLAYEKQRWTTVDLQRDYPAYHAENIPRAVRHFMDADIIRRDSYACTPDSKQHWKNRPVWRLNVECVDLIKKTMAKYEVLKHDY